MCILNGKSGSFLFTWLHFLLLLLLYCLSCVFFLCAFFSHVDSYERLRCTARIETIHHEILQTACPSVHTKSPFSFTLMLVPMCLGSSSILTSSYWDPSSSQRLSSLHRMRSCFFFGAPLAGKSIFVRTILATSPVYSVMKTEPLYEE